MVSTIYNNLGDFGQDFKAQERLLSFGKNKRPPLDKLVTLQKTQQKSRTITKVAEEALVIYINLRVHVEPSARVHEKARV